MKDIQLFNPYGKFYGSIIPNCLMRYKGISSTSKLIWGRLAQFAGKNGNCYPSLKTLAIETGITVRGVIKCIHELINTGFLVVERPSKDERAEHKTSRYYFVLHEIFKEEFFREKNASEQSSVDSEQSSAGAIEQSSILPVNKVHYASEQSSDKYNQLINKKNNNIYIDSPCIQFSDENFIQASPETSSETSSSSKGNNGTSKHKQVDIVFDEETYSFKGIEPFIDKWREAYPAVNLESEIKQMESWVMAQPKTRWKKNWKRFIMNWLSREQERQEFRKAKFGERRSFLDD